MSNFSEQFVVVCKFNKEVFNYLSNIKAKIIFIEDEYDVNFFAEEILKYDIIKKYHIKNLDSIAEVMKVAAQIKADYPQAKKIISPNEFSQYASSIIGTVINDSNTNILSVLTSRDKYFMKKALSDAGILVANFISVPSELNWNFIAQVNEKIGFPCIIKPKSGSSSLGVKKIDDSEQLANYLNQLANNGEDLTFYLCEAFINGEEYVVDAVWAEGEPLKFLLGKYDIPMLTVAQGNGLVGCRYVSREENPYLYQEILNINKKALDLCGVKNGITHTEFFVTPNGSIYLGEIATRMGGGPHEILAKSYTGYSLGELQSRAVMGDSHSITFNDDAQHFGYINLQPKKPGIIKSILSGAELKKLPGVVEIVKESKPGDSFHLNGSSSWCLSCIVKGGSIAEFNENLTGIIKSFNEKLVVEG